MERVNKDRALDLLKHANLLDLGQQADEIRKQLHPEGVVTFVVDRNINYTNVCINECRFCAFYRKPGSPDAYVLSDEELFSKIEETLALAGTQILIQGGLHPDLDLDYYTDLLRKIKGRYEINVHGFSPPEVCYLSDRHNISIRETIKTLKEAGLDSIPGGGAEILSDRVREVISPKKIKSDEWLKVMEEAHGLGMSTTATMMFGSVEETEDIIEHLDAIRQLQDKTGGFTAFIPWSFQPGNTELSKKWEAEGGKWEGEEERGAEAADRKSVSLERERGIEEKRKSENQETAGKSTGNKQQTTIKPATAVDYLHVLALSRIYLDNFHNVQASWVTQGLKLAQVALRFGANDFGSTMIEENVVRSAGVEYCVSKDDIINSIKAARFAAAQRDTYYKIIRKF